MTKISKDLERIEQNERVERLRNQVHILHPAGGLTDDFVYEPVTSTLYAFKTKQGDRGIAKVKVEYEDEKNRKGPHFYIEVEGECHYFCEKIPGHFLFCLPDKNSVEKWVKGEKRSLTTPQLQRLNGVYLRTFLDFPHAFEFSVVQLFIAQSWLTEMLNVVFYLGIKGEYGGGKTATGEAVVAICRHGYLTGNLSPPFVARSIQNQKLTIMVDELDSIAKTKDSDLNSIFRQGYRRGIKYSRVNPDSLETESFLIFGPKLFTVHSDIEEALQTRTVPAHVQETNRAEYPIVNLDKAVYAQQVYTENFLWYLDNILEFRSNDLHLVNGVASVPVDLVDPVDHFFSDANLEEQAEKLRMMLFEKKKTLLTERQLGQLCQLSGRNVELIFICFILSNLLKTDWDEDIGKTFAQKLIEEGERTEIGYIGILREVLIELWKEKQGAPDYKTETGLTKISNKELYAIYNSKIKKEGVGDGISPAKFKEYMLTFGFTDALNRTKLKVPVPDDPEPKSRLCNIFDSRVLRKLGIEEDAGKVSLKEILEGVCQWISENKDADYLIDIFALTEYINSVAQGRATEIITILKRDGRLFDVAPVGKLRWR